MHESTDTTDDITVNEAIAALEPSPLDKALTTRPFGMPSRYAPPVRITELHRPSTSYDPRSITEMEGYEEHGRDAIRAADALQAMQVLLTSVIDAREKSKRDPTLNEAAQVLAVAQFADTKMTAATKQVDAASEHIGKVIEAAEEELRTGIQEGAGHLNAQAAEIRAHCKSLRDATERNKFVTALIEANDTVSLAALLRGKHFLSGMTKEESDRFTLQFNMARNPELPARIQFLQKVRSKLDNAGSQLVVQLEGAMGADWGTVQKLRAAKAAATFN